MALRAPESLRRKNEPMRPEPTNSADDAGQPRGHAAALLLAGVTVLAFALRIYRLGEWNLEATEIFTLRDSVSLRFSNPRPLMYLLNYYVVRPLAPLDELGLRLLPALFGVLAIPATYLVGRRLVGTRAALFAAFLLAISGIHIYYSQYARYWTLVFLLSAVYPFVIYLGIRERNRRALSLGVVTGVLAVLAHPASVLLVGGLGAWLVATYLRPAQLRHLWKRRSFRRVAMGTAVTGGIITARFIPMLQGWIAAHDKGRGGEFLLHIPGGAGVKQISYLLAYAESLTLPVMLTGILGIYLLWKGRDRPLALLLVCLATLPIAFLLLLSLRTAISLPYLLMPTAPVFFLGAGVLLDRLAEIEWELRPRWLLSAAIVALIIATAAPTVISQYRDGRRYDLRGVARWLHGRLAPEDVVFSDQHQVLAHYLPETNVHRLGGDPAPLMRSTRLLRASGRGGTLWIVAPAPSHAFRTNPSLASLNRWTYDNCQLRNTVGVGRLDFRQHYLQIYRCPPRLSLDSPVRTAPRLQRLPPAQRDSVGARAIPLRANTSR